MNQATAIPSPVTVLGRWAVYQLDTKWIVVPTNAIRFYGRKDSALRLARKLNADDQALA